MLGLKTQRGELRQVVGPVQVNPDYVTVFRELCLF